MNAFLACMSAVLGASIVGTSIWVLIDANRLGMKRTERSITSNSPATWCIGCLCAWIIVFPLYLMARGRAQGARAGVAIPVPAGACSVPAAGARGGAMPMSPSGRLAPAWIGAASLTLGSVSIPMGVLFGVLAAPLWMAGLALGVWGAAFGGPGRRQAIWGIVVSVIGIVTMVAAIIVVWLWMVGATR